MLKLNPDKTDLIIIGTKQRRNRVISSLVKLLGSDTFRSDTVCNLGVVFDRNVNFCQHFLCFYHKHDVHRIRRHISSLSAVKQYQQH